MRFIYLDTSLVGELGHHANFCRLFRQGLSSKQIPMRVFANINVSQALRDEVKAFPLFRTRSYDLKLDGDPVIGWLSSFETASQLGAEDLRRIAGIEASDIVYMNWAWPAQLLMLGRWLAGIPAGHRPTVIAEVGADPGIEMTEIGKSPLRPRDPRVDPRAVLYRYAARNIPPETANRLHLVTYDRTSSAAFQSLLEWTVRTLPMPFGATTSRRRRGATRPITVSTLGHQRPDKGFHLIPKIAATLLQQRSDVRILVHNALPAQMAAQQEALRTLAREDPRVTLVENDGAPDLWNHLLEQSDLVICPYYPARYAFAHSGIVSEAIANAIPLVVPDRTALANVLKEFGEPGVAFEAFTADSIVQALHRVLDSFDHYSVVAQGAAEQWEHLHGPAKTVQGLLEIAHAASGATAMSA